MPRIAVLSVLISFSVMLMAQPEVPVGEWKGKTILLIGAHPDDDTYAHGTFAMLRENGNEIWVVVMTTGNVGTQDPKLSRFQLAQIRRQEELAALKEIGIPEDHYINLGYDDGMLEFEDQKEIVAQLVRQIRTIRPDILFAFDPGPVYQRWHKSDHRAAAYLAADATRVAMWRLLFEGQIIHEGLKAHRIPEFMFYDTSEENTWVDISDYADVKVKAGMHYISQFGPGWAEYRGTALTAEEESEMEKRIRRRLETRDGKFVEGFRYYKGFPDGMGN